MADDEGKLPRRLRAVLLADMKDYSALMGEDEAHAISGIDDIGAIFQRVVPQHGGTFDIGSGDRFLAMFDSAVEAFEAAVEIQQALAGIRSRAGHPLEIRMGMHLGEVVDTPFGLMGDSINVAARLQTIAEPGGIVVSDDLYRAVRNRSRGVAFRNLGLQTFKNIREPIRVHAVVLEANAGVTATGPPGGSAAPTDGERRVTRRVVLTSVATAAVGGIALGTWTLVDATSGMPVHLEVRVSNAPSGRRSSSGRPRRSAPGQNSSSATTTASSAPTLIARRGALGFGFSGRRFVLRA
jgi:class 3 adenylate cyclase